MTSSLIYILALVILVFLVISISKKLIKFVLGIIILMVLVDFLFLGKNVTTIISDFKTDKEFTVSVAEIEKDYKTNVDNLDNDIKTGNVSVVKSKLDNLKKLKVKFDGLKYSSHTKKIQEGVEYQLNSTITIVSDYVAAKTTKDDVVNKLDNLKSIKIPQLN